MVHKGRWNVPGAPAEEPRTHPKVSIVAESKERLIESAGLLKNLAVIHRRTRVRPQDFFRVIVLAYIGFHRAAAAVLTVPVDQMPDFVYDAWRVLKKNFTGEHPNLRGIRISHQLLKPIGCRDGIAVEQRNPLAARLAKGNVVSFAKPRVRRKENASRIRQTRCPRG